MTGDASERAQILQRLSKVTGRMTTATVAAMEQRHEWFAALDAEHRSWITLVARAGIDGFADWFAHPENARPVNIFEVAPQAIMRRVSLRHTVDLVRTTIEVCEEQIHLLIPPEDRATLSTALLHYSREVAFAAAAVYARAAELRGTWDARLESLVVDAILRGDADESVISRASTLGWHSADPVCVIAGSALPDTDPTLHALRADCAREGFDILASIQGQRLILVVGGSKLHPSPVPLATALAPHFGPGHIVVGSVVDHIVDAGLSARDATLGLRVAPAWVGCPRPVHADELLPERALAGDEVARSRLVNQVFGTLEAASGDLQETLEVFFEQSGSVEGTARALFVHANTVRYRLKRIHKVSSYSPTDARDAYTLRVALTLGRLNSNKL